MASILALVRFLRSLRWKAGEGSLREKFVVGSFSPPHWGLCRDDRLSSGELRKLTEMAKQLWQT